MYAIVDDDIDEHGGGRKSKKECQDRAMTRNQKPAFLRDWMAADEVLV